MQGSGTFGVESVLTSVVGDQDKVLICSNGAYGKRMTDICTHSRIPFVHYAQDYDKVPDAAHMAQLLAQDSSITHVAMVHSETTSGILNDIQSVGKVVRDAGRTFIVDAMSSFGGVDIPVADWGIDFLVSSANKCIQGVPGFSFILCRRDKLLASEGKPLPVSGPAGPVEGDGKGWQSGALPLPPMWCWPFPRLWMSWPRRAASPPGAAATRKTTACSLRRCGPWALLPTLTAAIKAPLSPLSSILPGYPSGLKSFTATSRSGDTPSTRVSSPRWIPSAIGNIGEIYPEDIDKLTGIIAAFLKERKEQIA